MRNIIIFLICCCACNIFISCYEDKGNYNYTDRGDITLEGWEEKHTVISLSDTLDITPQLFHPEGYDYLWLLYNEQASFDYDTIGRDYRLVWPVNEPQGNYKLLLKVTARSDGYSQLFYANVVITSDFSNGWFVLKSQNGETDIDFFTLKAERFTNLLSQSTGRKLTGEAQGISLAPNFALLNSSGEVTWGASILYVLSKEDCWMVNLADMSVIRDFSEMFFSSAMEKEKPKTLVAPDASAMYLFTDHNAHHANTQGSGTGQFGMAFNFKKDVETGNYAIRKQPGTIFYDQKNFRFLGVTYSGTAIIFSEDPKVAGVIPPVLMNNTGCKMEYMGINKWASEFFYALMSNANKTEKYVYTMYAPEIPHWQAEDQRKMGEYNLIYAVDTLKAGSEITEATLFAISSNLPYIYCNTPSGNAVHYYDIKGKCMEKNIFPIPAGEKITYMKSWYYDASEEDGKFDKFVIATENDGHYKVYLYDLLAGKPHPDKEPQILTGEGAIKAIQPIRSSMRYAYDKLPANF